MSRRAEIYPPCFFERSVGEMGEPLTPTGREKGPASLLNAVFIGYMIGTYSVMGKGGAQAIANMAGEYVGRELLAYAKSQGKELDSLPVLAEFLQTQDFRLRKPHGKMRPWLPNFNTLNF